MNLLDPGKGKAFSRVVLRCLLTGDRIAKTFRSTDSAKIADVTEVNMLYIYNDNNFWFFMQNSTFEQLAVSKTVVGNTKKWLSYQEKCIITLWNDQPISIVPPKFVNLKVIDTDLRLKTDTSSVSDKVAILSNGISVKVPLFIKKGEIIKINTRSGEYISRYKIH